MKTICTFCFLTVFGFIAFTQPTNVPPKKVSPGKSNGVSKVKPQSTMLTLLDTAFSNAGFKFAYPKDYKFSPKNNNGQMTFFNQDNSIIISVYHSSHISLQMISANWEVGNSYPGDDGWYKDIGKTLVKDIFTGKPSYSSDFYYEKRFGGSDNIWVHLTTIKKGAGIKEFEAVKASIEKRPVPVAIKEVVPGLFTMGIPLSLPAATGNLYGHLSIFNDGFNFIYFKKDDTRNNVMGNLGAMTQFRQWKLKTGFEEKGSIGYTSTANIKCIGFYGLQSDPLHPNEQSHEAYAFFNKPGNNRDTWVMHYRLGTAIPQNMQKEVEELLQSLSAK